VASTPGRENCTITGTNLLGFGLARICSARSGESLPAVAGAVLPNPANSGIRPAQTNAEGNLVFMVAYTPGAAAIRFSAVTVSSPGGVSSPLISVSISAVYSPLRIMSLHSAWSLHSA
jgi:hypothetical protein